MSRVASFLIVILSLNSCFSIDKNIKNKSIPTLGKQYLINSADISHEAPSDHWWKIFNDDTLNRLVEIAILNNHDIRIANESVITSRSLAKVKASALLPSVSGIVGRDSFAVPVQGLGPDGLKYDITKIGFDVSWEVDILGKNFDRLKAQRLRFMKDMEIYKLIVLKVAAEISTTYIDLVANRARILNLKSIILARKDALHIAQIKEENGVGSKMNLYNAGMEFNSDAAVLPELEALEKVLLFKLGVLIGKQGDELGDLINLDVWLDKFHNYSAGIVPLGLKSDILRRRPDIMAAEYELDATILDQKAQGKEFFPSFKIGGIYAGGGSTFGDALSNGMNYKNISGSFSLPILRAGSLFAQLKIAKSKSKIAALEYEKAILIGIQETESAIIQYIKSLEKDKLLLDKMLAMQAIMNIREHENFNTTVTKEEFLDTIVRLKYIENEYIESKAKLLQNLIFIHKALGGGFDGYKIRFDKDKVYFEEENHSIAEKSA